MSKKSGFDYNEHPILKSSLLIRLLATLANWLMASGFYGFFMYIARVGKFSKAYKMTHKSGVAKFHDDTSMFYRIFDKIIGFFVKIRDVIFDVLLPFVNASFTKRFCGCLVGEAKGNTLFMGGLFLGLFGASYLIAAFFAGKVSNIVVAIGIILIVVGAIMLLLRKVLFRWLKGSWIASLITFIIE